MEEQELIYQIADIIQDVRPDIVITHYPFENAGIASTRSICAQATLHAIACASSVRRGGKRPHYAGVYARKRLECVDGLFGLIGHVAYAEPFVRYRPGVYRHLPLEETSLRRAEETTTEWTERTCQVSPAKCRKKGELTCSAKAPTSAKPTW